MATVLKPAPVSIAQFSYDSVRREFTGEVSATNGFGRVYDDACDTGLTVVGATGREVVFVVTDEHRDAEGDVTSWTLAGGGFTMTLWND